MLLLTTMNEYVSHLQSVSEQWVVHNDNSPL